MRHLHANKMRHFIAHVSGCGVSAKNDADFGRALIPNAVSDGSVLPRQASHVSLVTTVI